MRPGWHERWWSVLAPLRPLPFAFSLSAALALTAPLFAADPIGYLDGAGCDVIAGWAQDPDAPDAPIDVHLYFGGPAGSGAPATATHASVHRDDLCTAIGSCAHGFVALSPLSLHDGVPRDVFAYGIDGQGGVNPLLGSAPRTLACAPEAQSGVRRKVADLASLEAWGFDSFWDLLPLADSGLTDGAPFPATPWLVRGDDDAPELWLIEADGRLRRRVAPEALGPWHLDPTAAETVSAATLLSLIEGTPLRIRPVTFIDGGLYVVDDPQPDASQGPSLTPAPPTPGEGEGGSPSAGSGSANGGSGGGAAGDDGNAGAASGCATAGPPTDDGALAALLACGVAAMSAARRRRAR